MRRLLTYALIGLTLILGMFAFLLHAGLLPPRPNSRLAKTTIIVYENGANRVIATTDPRFGALQSLIETAFSHSPYGLYQPASETDLISTPGQVIEIVYASPIRINIVAPYGEQPAVTIDRILLKVNGAHAGWSISGDGSYANAAPLLTDSTTTLASIRTLLAH